MDIQEFARLGGIARAKKMTASQRSEAARKAVNARWAKADRALAEIESTTNMLENKSRTRRAKSRDKQAGKRT